MADVWVHPQLAARDRWTRVGTLVGPVPALKPPAWPADEPARMDAVPALGQHTQAILRELGLAEGEIEVLRAAGAV